MVIDENTTTDELIQQIQRDTEYLRIQATRLEEFTYDLQKQALKTENQLSYIKGGFYVFIALFVVFITLYVLFI